MEKNVFFTTGEVARILGVAQKTVKNYCSQGLIYADVTPVTGYRRIPYNALVEFMTKHELPLSMIEQAKLVHTVLIVDDESSLVELYTKALEDVEPALDVKKAYDGYEGCLIAGETRPDLMIVDLNMPGVDGIAMLKSLAVAKLTEKMKVIVSTGYATPENIKMLQSLPQPPVNIFEKPVPLSELVDAVKAALNITP